MRGCAPVAGDGGLAGTMAPASKMCTVRGFRNSKRSPVPSSSALSASLAPRPACAPGDECPDASLDT